MIAATAIMILLNALCLLLIGSFVIWQWRYRFDVKRVADVMAADLIDTYDDDLHQLSDRGIREYARQRYMQLAATFGLPSRLVDNVCDMVAARVKKAQGEVEPGTGVAIYE